MSYVQLAYWHLATIFPAFLIGAWLLLNSKGTPNHRALGKVYMTLMMVSAAITLFMPAHVGPMLLGHFGFIHLLSFLVLLLVPISFVAARNHNIRLHRGNMIGIYVGGILLAGSFALMPGRLLHQWLLS